VGVQLRANYANLGYADMKPDIRRCRRSWRAVSSRCSRGGKDRARAGQVRPGVLRRYLTDYSVSHAEQVVKRYPAARRYPDAKYNDGYVQDEKGPRPGAGHAETWLREVLRQPAGANSGFRRRTRPRAATVNCSYTGLAEGQLAQMALERHFLTCTAR